MPNIKTGVGFFNPTPLVAGGGFEVSFSRFFVAVNINTLHFGRGGVTRQHFCPESVPEQHILYTYCKGS